MAQKGRDCEDVPEFKAVFIDTNLDTHLAIPVSSLDTIFDIKQKILTEHSKCFREFGLIKVHALKVKRKGKLYSLSDLMPVTSVFTGTSNGWFLSADISGQFCPNEILHYNNPGAHILIGDPSHLQRGHNKNDRIFQADEPSKEAQLVIGFKDDDKLKSSSFDSEKRLNTLVEDIYRANCDKDIDSSGLVTTVNPVKKFVNVHVHSSNANDAVEIVSICKDGEDRKNLGPSAADSKQCDHVVTDVGSADQNKIKDKTSSDTNLIKELRSGSVADTEQSVGIETHGADMKDVSMESGKTKGITIKKNKRMTKLEAMNDVKFTDIDDVSVKSLAADFGTTEKGSTVIPTNMDEAVTEPLGRVESVPDAKGKEMEIATNGSGVKRSKKRKNTGGDVSHQIDIKGKEELGVHENGGPLKRSKTGNDMPDDKSGMLSCKQQNQTAKPNKKVKKKQSLPVKKVSESGMKHQSDTIEPEKMSKSVAGKDDIEMERVLPVITSKVDIEMSSKAGLDDVLIPNAERNVKPQQESDETIGSDAKLQLTQASESVDHTNKRSSKKMNMKSDSSKSAFQNLTAENSNATKFLSSFQEQSDKAGSGADYNVDIEMKKAEIEVDEKVIVTNNGSEICSPQEEVDETKTMQQPKKLTSTQKRERDNSSKTEKSKKKIKQKIQLLKSIADLPVEDQNNSTKAEKVEKVENDLLSSAAEKIDDEMSTKVLQDINVSFQQEEVKTCQNDIEPMQLSQVKKVTKKKTKQQQKNLQKVIKDDCMSGTSQVAKNKADVMKSKVESSFLKTKDLNGYTSSAHSDMLSKRSHQRKELQKIKEQQSSLHSTKKVVQKLSSKNSLISKCSSIFKDESSSSSEHKSGGDDSNSSTEAPNDDHLSSDYSEDESRGSWASPKQGNLNNGGSASNSKSMQKNLTMEAVLRSSHKYKKAKLVASQSQLEEDESQPLDFVPDSQVNK